MNDYFVDSMAAPEMVICECQKYKTLLKGWEGSAILKHGSLLQFGCHSFVFSILNDIIDDSNDNN